MNELLIGIDIGGTNLRFALIDRDGKIICRTRTSSCIDQGRDAFCGRLLAGISELRSQAHLRGASVAGIGVGVPGLVGSGGLIHASVNMRPLDGFNLSSYLEEKTGIRAMCGNDANLIALGECIYGAGRGMKSIIVITVGTGLGSGLVLEGRLWTGAGGFASEFGHVTVEPDGLVCPCGNTGCLEQYVSAPAIVRAARTLLPAGVQAQNGDSLDAAAVATLARQGESAALAAFHQAGRYLGIAVASLVNTLNLEAAVIGGGVAASYDLLLPSLRKEVDRRCFTQMSGSFAVMAGELGDDAGLLGGAALVQTSMDQTRRSILQTGPSMGSS
ncbi:ROK family protein [Geobacter sp. SVR]|uniref:ROK family protein n=1 Tax=Geobacter sp. SVR TaxID=2495594 RepID=UPI00143EFA43|nr:ROK family protein [Geobacter sp. SVR]BCS53025.1 sugar kinase [Geobacter sp. SVR]GCF84410.1 sugar kinase [Geobacter sp. SVR]